MIVAVIGILVYSAATTLTYYMLDPLVSVLEGGMNADMASIAATAPNVNNARAQSTSVKMNRNNPSTRLTIPINRSLPTFPRALP